MATIIDSLVFELGLNSKKFVEDAGKAQEAVRKTRKSVEDDGKRLENSFHGVTESVNNLHRTLLALFAAFTGGKTIKALVGDLTDAGAATGRLATNLGMSADKVDAFGRAVEQMGGSSGDAKESLQRLTDQYQTFLQTGNLGDLPRIIGQLNTFGKTTVDVTKPLTGQLDAISDGLARIAKTDPAKASFIARQIFGNTSMANLALQGSKKMREMLRDAQETALTPKQAAIMEKLQQQVVRLQQSFETLGNSIIEALGPSLTSILGKANDWILNHIHIVRTWVVVIGSMAATFGALKLSVLAFGTSIGIATGGWLYAIPLLVGAVATIGMMIYNSRGYFSKWFDFGKNKFNEFTEVIKKSAPKILQSFKDGFGQAFDWLAGKLKWIWEQVPGHQIINWLWEKTSNAATVLNREFGIAPAQGSEYEGNPSVGDRVGPGHGRNRIMHRGDPGSSNPSAAPTPGGGSNPPHRRTYGEPDDETKRKIDEQLEKIFPPKGGSQRTGVSKNLADNQIEAYQAARAEGLSPDAAHALVANMSGESLANPSDNHWDVSHMSQGIVQWDPQRSEAIRQTFGKYPKDMTVAEQTKASIWEINNSRRFAPTKEALNSNRSREQMIDTLVRNYEVPRDKERAIRDRIGYLNKMGNLETAGKTNRSPVASFSQMGGAALSSNIHDMRQVHSYNSNATAHVNQVNIHVPSGDPQTIGTGLGNALQRQLAAGQANYGPR